MTQYSAGSCQSEETANSRAELCPTNNIPVCIQLLIAFQTSFAAAERHFSFVIHTSSLSTTLYFILSAIRCFTVVAAQSDRATNRHRIPLICILLPRSTKCTISFNCNRFINSISISLNENHFVNPTNFHIRFQHILVHIIGS